MLDPADYFDTCEFCDQLPTHFRATSGSNPIGGFDEHGKSRTEEELNEWLESLLVTTTPWPERIDATCDEHVWFERRPDGSARLSVAGEVQQRMAQRRTEKARTEAVESPRNQLLDFYNNRCGECEETENLQIQPLPGTTVPRYPSGARMTGDDKYRYLLLHDRNPEGWVLRCPDHPVQRSQPAIPLRQQTLAAYGNVCEECDETQGLQVWRLPDVEAPLSPSGIRLRGEAKLRYLRRMGFPQGWVLRCPQHPVR